MRPFYFSWNKHCRLLPWFIYLLLGVTSNYSDRSLVAELWKPIWITWPKWSTSFLEIYSMDVLFTIDLRNYLSKLILSIKISSPDAWCYSIKKIGYFSSHFLTVRKYAVWFFQKSNAFLLPVAFVWNQSRDLINNEVQCNLRLTTKHKTWHKILGAHIQISV